MGRKLHTGKFETRQELEDEIMRLQHTGWTHGTIGRVCGVSEAVVCRIFNQRIQLGALWQSIHYLAQEKK